MAKRTSDKKFHTPQPDRNGRVGAECVEHRIPDTLGGARLDKAVALLGGLSRKQARILIATGCVEVNGHVRKIVARVVRAGQRLALRADAGAPGLEGNGEDRLAQTTDRHRVVEMTQTLRRDRKSRMDADAPRNIEILHRESGLVFVNKPSGLLSEGQSRGGAELPSLEALLGAQLNKRVFMVHRLDAQTSGVMVVALNRSSAAEAGELFRRRQVQKTYWAICKGQVRSQEVNRPLGRVDSRRQGVRSAGGKPAATYVRAHTYNEDSDVSLVQALPHTGRTHQIRVHLQDIGHPILGDALYGGERYLTVGAHGVRKKTHAIPRVMLHAGKLQGDFAWKKSGPERAIEIMAPWPDDFQDTIRLIDIVLPLTTE